MGSIPPYLSIIVPTYNEALNIPVLAWLINRTLEKYPVSYELIIVDDASPDGTAKVCRGLAQHWPSLPIRVLSRPSKLGLGSAYLHGIEAEGGARGEFVLLLDADLSHHPKYIPMFIEKQKTTRCDVVTG
jgi:dolichol-phosphate mannosyltransferase